MQEEEQNDKMMPSRLRKQSEQLMHAIDRVFAMITERRRARSLHGITERPPYNILTAALELINMVKMILNILERPPFYCMSEFSRLKKHLIKHITLLKYFSEQSDINRKMESDMIDVCKDMTKICQYLTAMPPDPTELERQIPEHITHKQRPLFNVQVPITRKIEETSFSMEYVPNSMPLTRCPSVPITITGLSSERIYALQALPPPNGKIPDIFEYFSPESLNNPSDEGAVMVPHDEENKSEADISETKSSQTSASSLNYKSIQDLRVIESDTPLMDSGSELCVIDSDSDRGIGLDSDVEYSKDSDSVTWRMYSDSEKCPMDSGFVKHLLKDKHQMASGCAENLRELQHHLVGVEYQVDSDALDSDSEKCLIDSDSEKCTVDFDTDRPGIESDSEECPMVSALVKRLMKAQKHQMALDSVKRLLKSEEGLMEVEKHWMISASDRYMMDPDMERARMDSASAYGIQLIGDNRHQKKTRSKRYIMNSDSESCGMESDSEKCGQGSAAMKCLMYVKTFQSSTKTKELWMNSWSERHTVDLDFESLGMASGIVKHKSKAEKCQGTNDLERFWIGSRSASERCWMDSRREALDFECGRCWNSSKRYQHQSSMLHDSSGIYQDDFQKHWEIFERHQVYTDSAKCQTSSESESLQNEFEGERNLNKMEREQFLVQSEDEILQMKEEKGRHLRESNSEKESKITFENERHFFGSKTEAQQLGARRKENRPKEPFS